MSASTTEEIVIRPPSGWVPVDLKELVRHRDLLYFMVVREYSGHYRQSVFGIAWAFLKPVISLLVMSTIFGGVVGVEFEGYPYAVALFAGMLPWQFFASAAGSATNSLVAQAALLQKVYLPRIYLPLAAVGSQFVEFGISFLVYAALLAFYQFIPSWQIIFLPLIALHTILIALTVGLFFAGLNAKFRDVGFAIPFGLSLGMYLSPVLYPVSTVAAQVPESVLWLYYLNPMVGNIEAYRASILGMPWNPASLAISLTLTLFALVISSFLFRRAEAIVVDVA